MEVWIVHLIVAGGTHWRESTKLLQFQIKFPHDGSLPFVWGQTILKKSGEVGLGPKGR